MGDSRLRKIIAILILSIAIFCICLWILYSENLQNFKEEIEIVRGTLLGAVDFAVRILDLEFKQNSVYEALLNNDEISLNTLFNQLKGDYPIVAKIYLEDVVIEKVISAQRHKIIFDDNIKIFFKIYSNEVNDYLPNKVLLVMIDVEKLFQALGLTDIVVCEKGKFTILGNIKCSPKKSLLSLNEVVVSSTFSVLAGVLFGLITAIRKIRSEHALSKELLKKTVFQEVLLEFTKLVLSGQVHDACQYILEKAVQLVPGAQAGSLLMKKSDVFIFTNLYGYDKKIVGNIFFRPTELAQGMDGNVKVIKNLHKINDEVLDNERKNFLYSEGRVGQIKVLLSIPVIVRDEIIAFFNLDNFENEDAFTEQSIKIAELFAGQVGLLLERVRFEEELEKQRQMMEYYSYHDPLTGLANRRLLEEFAEKILALARRMNKSLCLLFMDLHKFKQINDTFGHFVGDQLLKTIALRIESAIRENDIVARLGGDEFIFLLNVSDQEVGRFTKRLLTIIQEPIVVDDKIFTVSANFGIAFYPDDGDNLETLLRHADLALYFSKRKNKPFTFFSELSENQM